MACFKIFCKCGLKRNRVVGGNEVQVNEYPWMALMAFQENSMWRTYCGGTVINSRWILSAAHCSVKNVSSRPWEAADPSTRSVILGDHDRSVFGESILGELQVFTDKIILHPFHDVSLWRIQSEIDLSVYTPVCLPSPSDDFRGKDAWLVGWGRSTLEDGPPSNVLNELKLKIETSQSCNQVMQEAFNGTIPGTLCWGGTIDGKGGCFGDSGGPLAYNDGAKLIQVGVVSGGTAERPFCAKEGIYGIYVEVAFIRGWLDEVVQDNGGAKYCQL